MLAHHALRGKLLPGVVAMLGGATLVVLIYDAIVRNAADTDGIVCLQQHHGWIVMSSAFEADKPSGGHGGGRIHNDMDSHGEEGPEQDERAC